MSAPNPGSDEAIRLGCTCPIFDNNHGRFPPMRQGGQDCWWSNGDCPIHDRSGEGDPEGASQSGH